MFIKYKITTTFKLSDLFSYIKTKNLSQLTIFFIKFNKNNIQTNDIINI